MNYPLKEYAITGAAGSLVGTSLAALAAHYFLSDQELIKMVVEALGTGAGGVGGKFLVDHIRMNMPREFRLRGLLRKKIASDFSNSYLDGTSNFNNALNSSYEVMANAEITNQNDQRLGIGLHWEVPPPLDQDTRLRLKRTLSQQTPIRINCAALFPAALAVLFSLRDTLEGFVRLNIDNSDLNSHDQFERLSYGNPFDFVIAAEAPFFLFTSKNSWGPLDPTELEGYVRIAPCHVEWQEVFARAGKRPNSIHVFQYSTAKLQYLFGKKTGQFNLEEEKISEGKQIVFFADGDALSPGECIIAWQPLSHLFRRTSNFKPLDIPAFKNWISLFASSDWISPGREPQLKAFRDLFIDEWRYLNRARGNYEQAYRLLVQNRDYLETFAFSSGLQRDLRYAPEPNLQL